MAGTAGSDRCSGRSPILTSTTTRCGDRVSAPRSGTTAMTTFMPACSAPMTIRVLRATCRRAVLPGAGPDRLALLCGEDSREIAGLPIDLIAQAIEPTEAQRAALDDLANASVTSAQKIKAACPTTVALTASGRLASMQQRIEAMISGVATVQPALDKLYGLLTDEQKARLNAVAEDQERKTERRRNRSVGAALRRHAILAPAMAGRGDRGAAASDRCATHRPYRPAERQRQGGRHAGHVVPDRRSGHATGAARRRRQAARRHAAVRSSSCAPRSTISMRC